MQAAARSSLAGILLKLRVKQVTVKGTARCGGRVVPGRLAAALSLPPAGSAELVLLDHLRRVSAGRGRRCGSAKDGPKKNNTYQISHVKHPFVEAIRWLFTAFFKSRGCKHYIKWIPLKLFCSRSQ